MPAIRYLGVYFDPQLNFKYHISTIVNKISKVLYFYRQAKNVLTFKAKRFLYFSSIHSNLIFAIHIWSCTTETSLNPLIIKHKMAIRILNDATYNAHTEPLFKSCGILPLFMYLFGKQNGGLIQGQKRGHSASALKHFAQRGNLSTVDPPLPLFSRCQLPLMRGKL